MFHYASPIEIASQKYRKGGRYWLMSPRTAALQAILRGATTYDELRGGRKVSSSIGENVADRTCECSQSRDCCQGQQNQQKRVFRQVLAFLFFPQTNHQVLNH